MAWLFGYPLSTLKDKLYSGSPIGLDIDRLVELVDVHLHAGIRPAGWPLRLSGRIHANIVGHRVSSPDAAAKESPKMPPIGIGDPGFCPDSFEGC